MTKHTIAKYQIGLHAYDMLPKDKNITVEQAYEKAGRQAVARLFRRMADNLEFNDDIGLFDEEHEIEFYIEQENMDAMFVVELGRIE